MMPGIINNPLPLSQAGATGLVSKLGADEAELPFSALQTPVTTARVCGPITWPFVKPDQHTRLHPVNVEAVCKPRVPENLETVPGRALPDYSSSGSDHDPSSVSLFAMVHDFIENNSAAGEQQAGGYNCSELLINKESSKLNGAAEVPSTLQSLVLCKGSAEEMLLKDTKNIINSIVTEVGHVCDDGKVSTMAHSCLKRTVMSRLQKLGYAAAICKTKWDHFGSIPAGDYEYIDVLPSQAPSKIPERLLVDINFQAEFEIARPSDEFTVAWQLLPPIFVGRAERLKQIIQIISEATKQSMHAKGLHLPPWRKLVYVKAKWFSSYKRTSNIASGRPCREGEYGDNGSGHTTRGGRLLDAKCTYTLDIPYNKAGSKLVNGDGRDLNMHRKERDEITVLMTEWQPPAIVPRCTAPSKQGRVMGLTYLLNAQAPSCNKALVQAA